MAKARRRDPEEPYQFDPDPLLADELGMLKAQQADLALKEEAIKAALLKLGRDEIDGKVYRVTISTVAGRETLDAEKLRRFVTDYVLERCKKIGEPSRRFLVKARVSARQKAK